MNALAQVLIFDKVNATNKTIEQLTDELIAAKADELKANQRRVQIEEQIIQMLGSKEEGAQSHKLANGLKVTITGKLSYRADMDMLQVLANALPMDMVPIKAEPKLDETGVKWLRANRPDLYEAIAPAITVKPAKTSVEVKA